MRDDPTCPPSGPVTLSSNAFGNCVGLAGSSCGDDSQVPGTATTCTSGQDESCDAGRGLCGWVVVDDGGRMPGGTALGGASRLRSSTTASAMTNSTTAAIERAAVQARARCRLLRTVVLPRRLALF